MFLNIFDSHTHSDTSWDARHSITFLCETAVKKGILGFAITDHVEINEFYSRNIEKRIRQGHFEMLKARAAFGQSLILSYGIELGQMTYDMDLTRKVLSMVDRDFVLASLHCIRGSEDFYYMNFEGTDPYALLAEYYEELIAIAKLGLFDSMAHISYPVRYMNGNYDLGVDLTRMDDHIETLLRILAQNGKALELNTSGRYRTPQHLRHAGKDRRAVADPSLPQALSGAGRRVSDHRLRCPQRRRDRRRYSGRDGPCERSGIRLFYIL